MNYPQLTDQLYTQLIRNLPRLSVPLAEYEFVYDPQGKQSGEIDPNALSAGGFPTIVLGGALKYIAKQRKQLDPKPELEKAAQQVLAQFEEESFQLDGLTIKLAQTAGRIGLSAAELLAQKNKLKAAASEISQGHLSLRQALILLVGSPFGLARVKAANWDRYQLQLVADLFKQLENQQPVGPFKVKTLAKIKEFIEIFVETSGLNQPVEPGQPRVICKVPWEASLGYAAAYVLKSRYPQDEAQVWMDLFADTGFYSRLPLETLTLGWSKRQQAAVQKLLQQGVNKKDSEQVIRYQPGKQLPVLSYQNSSQETVVAIKPDEELALTGIKRPEDLLALTSVFNMEAYFWDHYSLAKVDLNDPCERWLYLSNLLNAKVSTFYIYESLESVLGWQHRHPSTTVLATSLQQFSDGSQPVVLKEAGHCSTGGKEVNLVELPATNTTMLQQQVDSHLFAVNKEPLHGHVRCITITNSYGKVVNVGFVVKLSDGSKFNSSAYQSYRLFFDSRGRFVYGSQITGNQDKIFEDLATVGLQPLLSWPDWQRLLKQVRQNWLVSTLYLNIFLSNQVERKLAPLFTSGLLSANLWPQQGWGPGNKSPNESNKVWSLPSIVNTDNPATLISERRTHERPFTLPTASGTTTGFSQYLHR